MSRTESVIAANKARAGIVSAARRGITVCGVGINDADYVVCEKIDGVDVWCPFYSRWKELLKRCYGAKWDGERTVCKEWLIFSKFKLWMKSQDWQGKELDKDIVLRSNKHYSPDLCIFVTPQTNNTFKRRLSRHGNLPIGVAIRRMSDGSMKYMGQHASNGNNQVSLGRFLTPADAHAAWQSAKFNEIMDLAAEHFDVRVRSAIERRAMDIKRAMDNGQPTEVL